MFRVKMEEILSEMMSSEHEFLNGQQIITLYKICYVRNTYFILGVS